MKATKSEREEEARGPTESVYSLSELIIAFYFISLFHTLHSLMVPKRVFFQLLFIVVDF